MFVPQVISWRKRLCSIWSLLSSESRSPDVSRAGTCRSAIWIDRPTEATASATLSVVHIAAVAALRQPDEIRRSSECTCQTILETLYWYCSHSMRQGLCNGTVSLRLSACLFQISINSCKPLWRVCCRRPGRQDISINSGGQQRRRAVSSGVWTQTCYIRLYSTAARLHALSIRKSFSFFDEIWLTVICQNTTKF